MDKNGCSPLHWRAIKRNVELIDLLCKSGATVDAQDNELCTPLHITASHGYPECTSLLLEKGGQGDAPNVYGNTPFELATEPMHKELAEYMRTFLRLLG